MTVYGRGAKTKLEFHPNLKSLFRYNIYDPARLTPNKYKINNSCVLISIIIQLEYIKNGTLVKTKKKTIGNLLQYFSHPNPDLDNGITLDQFNTIEEDKDLFNKLKQLYPKILSNFEGLSLNLYTCQHSTRSKAFHLIPIRLGKFFSSRLNIDLLRDSKDIRPPPKKTFKKKDNEPTNNHFKHVLIILNFIRLHQTFRNYSICNMASLRNTEVCRR